MGNYVKAIGIGGVLAVVAAIFWQMRPLPEAIGLFKEVQPPELGAGIKGPLGQRPVKRKRFVRVDNAVALEKLYEAELPVDVVIEPFAGVKYRVTVETVRKIDKQGEARSIRGTVDSDFYGRLNLVLTNKLARGTLHVDHNVYEFLPVSQEVTAVIEVKQSEFPREKRPRPAHKSPPSSNQDRPMLAVLSGTPGFVARVAAEEEGEPLTPIEAQLPYPERKPFGPVVGAVPVTGEVESGREQRSVAPRGVLPEISVLVIRADKGAFRCRPLADENLLEILADSAAIEGNLDGAFRNIAKSRVTLKCMSELFNAGWYNTLGDDWANPENARMFLLDHQIIQDARREAEADVVVLVVEGQDPKQYCGWSMFPDYPEYPINFKTIPSNELAFDDARPNATWVDFYALNAAFSVVVDGCEEGNYSMGHEIGHLLGMKHERFNEFGGDFYNHGYGYPVMRWLRPVGRTIMAYPGYCSYKGVDLEKCSRVNEFSFAIDRRPGFLGWIRWVIHNIAGPVKGRSCEHCGMDSMKSAASNFERLKETAHVVATYSESFEAYWPFLQQERAQDQDPGQAE